MTDIRSRRLTRQQIGEFIGTPRGVRAFEDAQSDLQSQSDALTSASFLVLADQPSLGAERVLVLTSSDLTGNDGGENGDYTISLTPTAVVAGAYGSATKTISASVDAKGRITAMTAHDLISDNISEGGTNLYFTNARARGAISGSSTATFNGATGEISITGANIATALTYTPQAQDAYLTAISGTVPAANGTYASPTSVTIVNGIITAIS